MRGPLQSERLLNKQAHQSGLRPAVRILLKPHEKCRLGPSVLLNIYILQILLFLWLYFLSISLVGDTYHTPHPPPLWHWWMAPGPSPQRHRSISHGHTQIVDGAPVSQPASNLLGRGTPACLGPSGALSFSLLCAPPSTCMEAVQWNYQCVLSKAVWMPHPRHGELYLLIRVLWVRALLQLQYSASPRGGTVALQFSPLFFFFFWEEPRMKDRIVSG